MDRLTVITCDAHAGPPTTEYREYLEARFHPELDDYLEERERAKNAGFLLGSRGKGFASFSQQFLDDFRNEPERHPGGPAGAWDFGLRRKELESDGIVAEVIFPGPANVDVETQIPFQGGAFFGDLFTADRSLDSMWAGASAYNRWLAERVDHRHQAALALVPSTKDIERVLSELRWAAEAGCRGIVIRQMEHGLPLLHDSRYEPIWATAEELGLLVHFHGGIGMPLEVRSDSPAALLCSTMETAWWNYRPLWCLIFGGVFERHPNLKVVFTEGSASWVPTILDTMDVRYEDHWLQYKDALRDKPSDYWYRHCYVGASFLSRPEVELLDLIGPANAMFGNDYPHVEGIWPQTKSYLHEVLAGNREDVARSVCAENAARLYGFDLAYLNQLAEAVGPLASEVLSGSPSPASTHPTDRMAARAARPASWVMAGVPRGFTRAQ